MSIKITSRSWESSAASGSDLLVLLAIADHCDDNGVAYPGVARLARKARICERSVQYALRRLVALGELEIDYEAARHGCNLYRVLAPKTQGGANLAPVQPTAPGGVQTIAPESSGLTVRDKEDKKDKNRRGEPGVVVSQKPAPIQPDELSVCQAAKQRKIAKEVAIEFFRLNESRGWQSRDAAKRWKPIKDWVKALVAFAKADAKKPKETDWKGNYNDEFWAWANATFDADGIAYVRNWLDRTQSHGWKIKNEVTGRMEPIRDIRKAVSSYVTGCERVKIDPGTLRSA